MEGTEIFIMILAVLVSLVMALLILVQNPKGGGLATGFSASNVGGVQKTADFLEKSTWYLVIFLFVLCLASARFSSTGRISRGDTPTATEQTDDDSVDADEANVDASAEDDVDVSAEDDE